MSEVIEDVVHFFVRIDTLLTLEHRLEARDYRGYERESGQFETSCRSEFGRKIHMSNWEGSTSLKRIRLHMVLKARYTGS
jgi:hypothetical protein